MKNNSLRISQFIYVALIYLFFYLPIVVIVIYSFNKSEYSLVWHGFSTHWYQVLFNDPDIWKAAMHSLVIGLLAASVALIIGLLAAINIYRYRFFGRNLLHALIFILIVVPDIVMGTAFLIVFQQFHIPLGFWSLLIAHITFCVPFVTVTVYSRLTQLDKNIFEAAKDLGANDLMVLLKIIVPLLMPALIAGWILSFTLSIDDVIISFFVTGPSFQILPLLLYSLVRVGINPEINALCTIIIVLTFLLVVISQLVMRSKRYR